MNDSCSNYIFYTQSTNSVSNGWTIFVIITILLTYSNLITII